MTRKAPIESIVEYAYEQKVIHDVLDIVEQQPWYELGSPHMGCQFRWAVRLGVWRMTDDWVPKRAWTEINA
jgi:hypothetical protein